MNTYAYVDSNPLAFFDPEGLAKGGKKNLNTQGLTKKSPASEVQKALNEAKTPGQRKALRALLKVIKRGGTMIFVCSTIANQALQCFDDPCSCNPDSVGCFIAKTNQGI